MSVDQAEPGGANLGEIEIAGALNYNLIFPVGGRFALFGTPLLYRAPGTGLGPSGSGLADLFCVPADPPAFIVPADPDNPLVPPGKTQC